MYQINTNIGYLILLFANLFFKIVILFILLSHSFLANANFLIFPEIKIDHTKGDSLSKENITPSFDIFASGNLGPVLLLSEAYVSDELQHIERLQIGFNMTGTSRVWFGRHHNPYGYWHTQYHHGTFLQTSISRPSIAGFGAGGGIVPSHSTGVLLEGELEQQESVWHYALSIGLTSNIDPTEGGHHGGTSTASLHDFDVLNPDPNEHKLGYTFRLAYSPDALAEKQVGSFISHEEIVFNAIPHQMPHAMQNQITINSNEVITLDILGIFANYQQGALHLISEAYYLSSKVPIEMIMKKNSFSAAYLQVEYALDEQWTPYFRLDRTFSYENDPYLNLLDGYPVNANTLGIRLDLPGNNALKLEYSKRSFTHDDSEVWLINWSAIW